jgi:hypothetical protein
MKIFLGWSVVLLAVASGTETFASADLAALLPKPADWTMAEKVQRYLPASLFEYIDGAAESYIGYEFRELVVGQYQIKGAAAALTAEIYDMGNARNAFGIYGSERYPESAFLPVGVQGYLEEGSLNFLAGRYYVKLLCFEGGAAADGYLKQFAAAIVKAIGDGGGFPPELGAFPKAGLVANSEKFILSNVLGFKFLSHGYVASYKVDEQEFDAFLIVGRSPEEAASVRSQVLAQFAKAGAAPVPSAVGVRLKDPYLAIVILGQSGRYLCGVTKVKEGGEAAGEKVVAAIIQALARR